MEIITRTADNSVVGSINGRLDATTASSFDTWFRERLQAENYRLVLDLAGLDYISSAGLRSLLSAAKQIKSNNGALVLAGLGGTVEEVFRISGFLSIFQVYAGADEAVAALAG